MSSDFEAYEQDFGTITAEITNKIGRVPKLSGGKRVIFVNWTRCASYKLAGKSELRSLANLAGDAKKIFQHGTVLSICKYLSH